MTRPIQARPSLPGPAPTAGRRGGAAGGELLVLARRGLVEAGLAGAPGERYAAAHLAALRAAAAVLAARAQPASAGPGRHGGRGQRGRRPTSAWVLLARVAPELAEWAALFAAGARKRAAAEAGLTRVVSAREADDLLRDAETFLALVETTLGLAHQPTLAGIPA
ncbi:MAG: SAV_6107 family HEPN domain-containing protein [Frankiaceae bacterium]